MVASAFSEVISLGAVLPFIGILTPPEKVFNNVFVKSVCESFGITAANELVLPLTVIFVCAAILAGATTMQKSKIKLDFEHDTIILDPRVAKLKLV